MAELAVDDQDGGELDEGEVVRGFLVPADEQPPEAVEPAVPDLNGSIINDKFCLSHAARLRLSWHRARHARPSSWPQAYPPDEVSHRGGGDEAAVASAADDGRDGNRGPTVGPRLSAPPAMGDGAVGGGHAVSDRPRGGKPCA